MARLGLSLLLKLFCNLLIVSTIVKPAFARHSSSRASIEASCRATRYPVLCIKCLSSYANTSSIQTPEELAHLALSASIYRALYTRKYMLSVAKELEASNVGGYQVVKDCLAEINDSIEQLSQSIKELRHLGIDHSNTPVRNDFFWHINNVETWVSAALTDTSTCLDEFPTHKMGKLKATIKEKVLNVAQATSNALALFHRYAAKYRATSATRNRRNF